MIRFICRDVNWADVARNAEGPVQVSYRTFTDVAAMEAFLRSTNQYNNRELIGCELATQGAAP